MIAHPNTYDEYAEASVGAPERAYVRVEPPVWAALAVGLIYAVLSANPALTTAVLLVPPILISLLWRRGEVPILLFAATFQWVQVSTKVFQANTLGVRVSAIGLTPTVELSIWLGLAAVVALALGMRTALRGADRVRGQEAADEASFITVPRAFWFYVLCAFIGEFVGIAMSVVPPLKQVLTGVAALRWSGFFIFGYVVFKHRTGYLPLVAVVAFEFVRGIGFFAGFKTVVFVLAIVIFTVYSRLNGRTVVVGLAGLAGLLVLGATWTGIKGEYRAFLNQGSGQQETVVSDEEQIAKMVDLVTSLSWNEVVYSLNPLLDRLAYVDYFGMAMDHVPSVVPYQNGLVWSEALQNLVPRAFFPDKPRLVSDSEHTMRYTGLVLASDDEGTSISMGYVTDSYIDFGPYWMFVPVFLVGLLWGLMYRYFLATSPSALVGFALATAALITAYQFEMAAVKLVAGVTAKFIGLALVLRFAGGWMTSRLGIDLETLAAEDPDEEWAGAPAHA